MPLSPITYGLLKITFWFLVFFALTIFSSSVGDDDVVYNFLDRKPSANEAIARIRFVIAKTIASILGGSLMSIFVGRNILEQIFLLTPSKNQAVILALVCIALTSLLIGAVQNIVRLIQGRQLRPVVDMIVLKHNLKLWLYPRN